VELLRHQKYDNNWIVKNQMGLNPLLLTEWGFCNIEPDNSEIVLDLACGKATSSIFIAKEYNCKVFAVDLWVNPTENLNRIKESGMESLIVPLSCEARKLPFPKEYFDYIICTDSFIYFGTDDTYIPYIKEFIKPGGYLIFTVPGFPNDEPNTIPEYLKPFWADECWTWHNPKWWERHISRYDYYKIEQIEVLPNGIEKWIEWKELRKKHEPDNKSIDVDINVMNNDKGKYMGFIKVVAKRIL
jgi:cyclopropane fatty-acyl-phospholipid synthase-like methyltransferase